ncbi:metal ABC transporter solute-binding protein, Zn/Mn family [Chloroflexus sp.]|uniref:metal ABC transporter solute-binding protein, Zn/Mn family n=1 Tax=Chloroflexus sp. TaxID=1904827 RepID=UPI00404B0404
MQSLVRIMISLIIGGLLLAACGQSNPTVTEEPAAPATAAVATDEPMQVMVSILPQKYFVERVGGDRVKVDVMVGPGASPATYEPKPEQLTALSQAKAYFSIGVPFEQAWLERIQSANPAMLLVDTTAGIERMPMGAGGRNRDPHIWLSPTLVKIQAQTIAEALARIDPEHATAYQSRLDGFIADIDALDASIRKTLEGVSQRKFMVFHPSWGYFARDYGLEQIPIEIGGQEPSAAELAALIERARAEQIKVIFAQPQFSTRAAETIASQIGGEVLLINPLNPDWLGNLQTVAETFARVMK